MQYKGSHKPWAAEALSLTPDYSPLGCPLSARALALLPRDVKFHFYNVNRARLTGCPIPLEEHLDDLHRRTLRNNPAAPLQELAFRAAYGDYLSVLGRWSGDTDQLTHGVAMLRSFIKDASHVSFDDNLETCVRAHLELGTALVRQGYNEKDPELLREAVREISQETHPVRSIDHLPLHAAIHRDLGDAYIGQLHWDDQVVIDGKALRALGAAIKIFSSLVMADAAGCMRDELAATKSSLALAQAWTAGKIEDGATLDRSLCPHRSRNKLQDRLRAQSRELCLNVWRAYIHLLNNLALLLEAPDQRRIIPFRWTRTVSNVAFAATALFEANHDDIEMGKVAEAAFRSVTQMRPRNKPYLFLEKPELDGWAFAFIHGGAYSLDDHPERFERNVSGLEELANMAG